MLAIINLLLEFNIIKKVDLKTFKVSKEELFWGNLNLASNEKENKSRTMQIEADYAKNYIEFLKEPKGQGTFTSGFVQIPDELLADVIGKINVLRDFIFELSMKTSKDPILSVDDKNAYQIGLQLFPLFHKVQ